VVACPLEILPVEPIIEHRTRRDPGTPVALKT
jgi:hypothetical protein